LKNKQDIQSILGRYNYRYNRIFRKACTTSTYSPDYPSLSTSTSIQTHSRRKLSWRDLGSEAKTRAFLPRKYGSKGVPRATPTAASRHLPEDIRRKAKEVSCAKNISPKC